MLGAVLFLCLYILPALGLVLWLLVGFVGLGISVATLFGPKPVPAAPPVPPAAPASSAAPIAPPVMAGPGSPPPADSTAPAASGLANASAAATGSETGSPTSVPPQPAAGPSAPPLLAAVPLASGSRSSISSGSIAAAHAPSALTHPRAGFWIRTGALAIDLILVAMIFFWCLTPLLHGVLGAKGPFLPVLAAYGAVLWKVRGSTIGGIIFGLRVVRLDDRPIDWGTAVVRALACFLSLIVFGLGFIWVAFDPEKQSWHDKIAGTTVVRAPKAVSLV
jgi:uncharacterized RDD family membrane protein YckC